MLTIFCQPSERITASTMKTKNFEGAFVISCEQDHSVCMPLIKSGTCYEFSRPKDFFFLLLPPFHAISRNKFCTIVAGLQVFDSELLLNGIVTQSLEFDRYIGSCCTLTFFAISMKFTLPLTQKWHLLCCRYRLFHEKTV